MKRQLLRRLAAQRVRQADQGSGSLLFPAGAEARLCWHAVGAQLSNRVAQAQMLLYAGLRGFAAAAAKQAKQTAKHAAEGAGEGAKEAAEGSASKLGGVLDSLKVTAALCSCSLCRIPLP